jgi:hypothetical protein
MRVAAASFIATLVVACSHHDSAPASSLPAGAVYSESFDYAAVERDRLPQVAAHGLELYQAMQPADFRSPALASLLAACRSRNIAVRAWIVLPKDQGYWPGETNLDAFGAAVDSFLAWVHDDALAVSWFTFDLEPDWTYTQSMAKTMNDATNPHRIDDFIALIKPHVDQTKFAASQAKLSAIVDRVHAAGLRAHAVTYPMVVDGMKLGNTYLEDGFDIPVSNIAWDEVSLMVYRSTWQSFSATPLSSQLFSSYGADAKTLYGDKAALDFGTIGNDPVSGAQGYTDATLLAADIAAARASGIARVHLYSLEESLAQSDAPTWLSFNATAAGALPDDDANVRTFRALFATLDAILSGK